MASPTAVPPSLRQAAKAIRAAQGRALQLRGVFDQSLIPMTMVDNDRRYVEANAAARFLARISLEAMRRLRIDDFTAPEDMAVLASAWEELTSRGSVSGRYRTTFPDGSSLWLLYAAIANALPGLHLLVFVPADWPCEELEAMQLAGDEPGSTPLSNRQLDVLRLVASGASAAEMASEL